MKKFLMMMFAAAAMVFGTACEKDAADNDGTEQGGTEQGGDNGNDDDAGLRFGLRTSQNGVEAFADEDAVWRLERQGDGTYTLFMDKTHFVKEMPMLDMEVRGLANESGHDLIFDCNTDSIVPYFNDRAFQQYVMTDFHCTLKDTLLTVFFHCAGYEVSYLRQMN